MFVEIKDQNGNTVKVEQYQLITGLEVALHTAMEGKDVNDEYLLKLVKAKHAIAQVRRHW